MAASNFSGPAFFYGNLTSLTAAAFGSNQPDPNPDAGPGGEYQGNGIIDSRFFFPKDRVAGFTGTVPAHFNVPSLVGVNCIPAATASNNIAASQHITSGTAMTLAAASVGITRNVPIRPFSAALNGNSVVTAAIALDFGFEFGNVTSGSAVIPVSSAADFFVGMPLVIGGVGNSGGTAPLLCNVLSINTSTPSITVSATPLATNTAAPIGTGDLWGPSEIGFPTPQAAMPWLAAGPGLWLDPRQALARAVRIVASAGTGGTFTVKGLDIYHQPQTETITVASGSSKTGWGVKAFKYIYSVTPNYTDSTNNYTVGTSDVFGCNYRTPSWEQGEFFWAGSSMSASTGWTAPDDTSPATATTGDVRGTIQVNTNAGGSTGIGTTASNGTVSSLAMSGNRFAASLCPIVAQSIAATQANPWPLFGVTPA